MPEYGTSTIYHKCTIIYQNGGKVRYIYGRIIYTIVLANVPTVTYVQYGILSTIYIKWTTLYTEMSDSYGTSIWHCKCTNK